MLCNLYICEISHPRGSLAQNNILGSVTQETEDAESQRTLLICTVCCNL